MRPSPQTADVSAPHLTNLRGARVLVSDEHYKHCLGIVRYLGQQGVDVSIVATSKRSLVCRSRYCHRIILCPSPTPEALVETLLQSVKSERFDLIIPVSYPMTLALARRREEFGAYTHLELVESQAIEFAGNKARMMNLAARVGVPAPTTIVAAETETRGDDLMFPVVIKPKNESPGRRPIRYARDLRELRVIFATEFSQRSNAQPEDFLVQEFIPGFGCGFFATYQRGVCKRVFMHQRVREYPATGGVSSCAESFYDARLEELGRRMLDALDWHGIAMVEFRRDSRDGEYKLMEINPKFWGSLDLALAAGADFPGDLCHMALGAMLPFTNGYRRGLRFHWPFSGHGELFHLWTRPQSVFRIGLDFLNPSVKSNVWLSDFGPNGHELRALAGKLFGRRQR